MRRRTLLLTLALTTFLTTGCSLLDFIKIEPANEQKEDKKDDKPVEVKHEISLDETDVTIKVGEMYKINASVYPFDSSQDVFFGSDDSEVCTVDYEGLVIGVGEGNCSIKVTWAEDAEVFDYVNFVVRPAGDDTDPTHYNVTFDANGGSGLMPAVKTEGSTYTVPGCNFTYDGHSFDKWALNSPSGETYEPSEKIVGISADFTLYALWKVQENPDLIDDNYGDYYASISDELTGQDLINSLNTLNNQKRIRTMTYHGLKSYGKYTEIDWTGKDNVSGKMFGFYDNALVCNEWDNQATWNREHVWPKSLGGGKVEADMYMPRPCSVKINSDRGNKFYGSTSGSYDPGQFEANYRGVAARIIFYCAIADKSLDIISGTSGDSTEMGDLTDLLKWNLQYAPSKSANAHLTLRIEANRNKVMFSHPELQGNRNPFVDHPEYACRIWGNRNNETKQICGLR